MIKRITSVSIIVLLLTITGVPYTSLFYNDNNHVYAETTLSATKMTNLAICMYFNNRNAWIKNPNIPNSAVEYIRGQFQEFLDTTSDPVINSVDQLGSEFCELAKIQVPQYPSPVWQLNVQAAGVAILNQFANWYVKQKGKLPNLYNPGTDSWSDSETTNNNVYNGYFASTGNFFVVDVNTNQQLNDGATVFANMSDVQKGSTIGMIQGDDLMADYLESTGLTQGQFNDTSKGNSALGLTNPTKMATVTVPYFADVHTTLNFVRRNNTSNNDYGNMFPQLHDEQGATGVQIDLVNNAYSRSCASALQGTAYANRVTKINSNPALIVIKNSASGINTFYTGWVSYDLTNQYISLVGRTKVERNDVTPSSTDVYTTNFEESDTPENDTDYTPTNTTDNNNPYDENDPDDFYNDYIDDYTDGETESKPVTPVAPEPPDGGNTPPWGNDPNNPGTITPTTPPGSDQTIYNITFPDFHLPDLNIDWKINGLQKKFPFSIPWDLMAFFTVLNADPVTPELQGRINLGLVNWDIDWDLHNFDTLAGILRNLEFIGFCLALILITRHIIKG